MSKCSHDLTAFAKPSNAASTAVVSLGLASSVKPTHNLFFYSYDRNADSFRRTGVDGRPNFGMAVLVKREDVRIENESGHYQSRSASSALAWRWYSAIASCHSSYIGLS